MRSQKIQRKVTKTGASLDKMSSLKM